MRWQLGRQNSGYYKFRVISKWFFDCYILKFVEGSVIKPHTDKVTSKKHYRLNIILAHAEKGGEFNCTKYIVNKKYFKLFRPDLYTHSVTEITKGTRYVLSIGIAI